MRKRRPLVLPGKPGRRVVVRQHRVERPPYTNCGIVDLVRLLIWGGVVVPDRSRLVAVLRKATGVPEVDPATGRSQGTTTAERLAALAKVMPWVMIRGGFVTDEVLLEGLAAGTLGVSVSVPTYNSLPGNLARWAPSFDRGHQVGLADARKSKGAWWVLWVDGLGSGAYRGEWVRWASVRPHLSQAGGVIFATVLERGAAMSTAVLPVRTYSPPATVSIPKGTDTFAFDLEALALVPGKKTGGKIQAQGTDLVRVIQAPRATVPGRPHGRMVRISSGALAGAYVRAEDVTVTENPAPAQDCAAQIEAVAGPLRDEVERLGAILADGLEAARGTVDVLDGVGS